MKTPRHTLIAALPLMLPLTLLVALLVGSAPHSVQAQPSAATRDTEALRRAQRNLQQAQQERDAAQAEKVALQRERDAEAAQQKQAQGRLASLQRESQTQRSQLQSQIASLDQQLQAAQNAQQETKQASASAETAWARERQFLRQDLDGRTQTNQAVVAQLAAARAALDETRQRNQELHALGLELLDLYRQAPDGAQWQRGERLLGLAGVRIEERAETARARLDAAHVGGAKTSRAAPTQP